jgi:peroxiredoxin
MSQNDSKPAAKKQLVIGELAPDVSLEDQAGNAVALSSLWQSRPRVLLFVRHFG